MTKLNIGLLAALPLLALAGACASTTGPAQFDQVSITSDSRFAEYQKVYIADVSYDASIAERTSGLSSARFGGTDRPVRERDLKAKADDLERVLKREIGKTKKIVASPGDGVLTVSARITDLAANQPTMADISEQPSLSQESVYAGKSSVAITLSENGRTLANLSETYQGDLNDSIGRPAIWQDVDRGFYFTANKVARFIS
ncbi:DUF3313 domain-containing protein [Parvularcula flava]|uniref:DUF3313 domain-containing protein n=1 Tax=Aquisalinus luteolus TaxID=1566827 RepID=A0A8J3A871_9PROT|nr:DUF3313 family protein [Aquisalinus luteolus]NHK28717.1 DUF3313 domain-containing protein [Aquisalinus luteolus]GGH99305.1 hypothetical protein GCM10011355_24950 [Aquisalinus luteolus]